MKTATLTRLQDDGIQTFGKFEFDDTYLLSLERPWMDNANDISCIPVGTYKVTWMYETPKHPDGVYQLVDVPGRDAIQIHSANYVSQLEGCIALGMNKTKDGVIASRLAISHIKEYFGVNDWELTIVNG